MAVDCNLITIKNIYSSKDLIKDDVIIFDFGHFDVTDVQTIYTLVMTVSKL